MTTLNYQVLIDELFDRVENDEIEIEDYYQVEMYAAFAYIFGYEADEFDDWKEKAEEAYQGSYENDADFAQSFYEEIGAVSEDDNYGLSRYIDWEWASRDLMFDFATEDGFYFSSNF